MVRSGVVGLMITEHGSSACIFSPRTMTSLRSRFLVVATENIALVSVFLCPFVQAGIHGPSENRALEGARLRSLVISIVSLVHVPVLEHI